MAQLRRIILLHTHLEGAVEIDVDEHTNFCGTNASGKTTLQRLIPVFYGEQPNKVVPKTRKKFDEFYLPYSNSYIIYEYERDNGVICQAVLTRKSDGGVEYRFVGAPYHSQWYLSENEQGVFQALSYPQWASAMRHHPDVQVSPKLSATSEYRSIIQNDVTVMRTHQGDSVRLRRLAANFALVSGSNKLRHIEKLVSAVHAKEGKMDTLKSMLAAIFEEDGVTLPSTRVKNTKAREWIAQMRQSMRLEKLETDFTQLSQLATELEGTERQLSLLGPQLAEDQVQLQTRQADAQHKLQQVKEQLNERHESYRKEQDALNESQSKATYDLHEIQGRLDQLQKQFDEFEDADMLQLQRDIESLPLWREQSIELAEQHALMVEQHSDFQQKLEQQRSKLNAALQRLSEESRHKTKQLQQQKDQLRERQSVKKADLETAYRQQVSELEQAFNERRGELKSQIAVLEHQLQRSLLSEDELQALALSEKRLEQTQQNYQVAIGQLTALQNQWQKSQVERDQADDELSQARRVLHQREQRLRDLQQQLAPQTGTLRHYLQHHYPQWQQQIGKVIDAQLLDRRDLQPDRLDEGDSFYGIRVDLAAIDLPEYAQDDSALTLAVEQAQDQLSNAQNVKQLGEKALQNAHQQSEKMRKQVEKAQWSVTEAEQNIEYARDGRDRLTEQHQVLNQQRQQQTKQNYQQTITQLEQLEQAHQGQIAAFADDHQAQLLEFQFDWQSEQQVFDEQLLALDEQLEQKRANNHEQIQGLEAAFNEQLTALGVDPRRIADLKTQQQTLNQQIQTVQSRQDELTRYQQFIRYDWQQQRPKYLEQETDLKQQIRTLNSQLTNLKTQYQVTRKALDAQRVAYQQQQEEAQSQLEQLQPFLAQLAELNLPSGTDVAPNGDFNERLSRCREALKSHHQLSNQLRQALEQFELLLSKDASRDFLDRLEYEKQQLPENSPLHMQLVILEGLLHILRDQQQQLLEMGENIGGDLKKFFTVFRDINQRIARQSRRLSEAVADDLNLPGIEKSEVKIISTIDELGFWGPLKAFAKAYDDWSQSSNALPSETYLNALADVVELLRSDEQYRMESLLRLELHLTEGGTALVIKNDRQLLESSSHGMAYLILCKYLLAFTRLMRSQAPVMIHWPIDEIGTLAYHNVEKLFKACSANNIVIVGAFPNPESDVLMLFKHRYLLLPSEQHPNKRQIKRIQPKMSRLAERLLAATEAS